jgi:hypothetical protein
MNERVSPAEVETAELFLPELKCDHCGKAFKPRTNSGGKPQRFCSLDCRADFYAQCRQRGPTCNVGDTEDATPIAAEETPTTQVRPSTGVDYVPDDYEWKDDDVVLEEQKRTAIYWNIHGDAVIRQMGSYPDDDPYVVICRSNLFDFIDRLCDFAGIPSVGRR